MSFCARERAVKRDLLCSLVEATRPVPRGLLDQVQFSSSHWRLFTLSLTLEGTSTASVWAEVSGEKKKMKENHRFFCKEKQIFFFFFLSQILATQTLRPLLHTSKCTSSCWLVFKGLNISLTSQNLILDIF